MQACFAELLYFGRGVSEECRRLSLARDYLTLQVEFLGLKSDAQGVQLKEVEDKYIEERC